MGFRRIERENNSLFIQKHTCERAENPKNKQLHIPGLSYQDQTKTFSIKPTVIRKSINKRWIKFKEKAYLLFKQKSSFIIAKQ